MIGAGRKDAAATTTTGDTMTKDQIILLRSADQFVADCAVTGRQDYDNAGCDDYWSVPPVEQLALDQLERMEQAGVGAEFSPDVQYRAARAWAEAWHAAAVADAAELAGLIAREEEDRLYEGRAEYVEDEPLDY